MNVPSACPECGAATVDGVACRAQFETVLAWEQYDAELVEEHFLTVASYNLQHPSMFTPEARSGLRESFLLHLDGKLSVPQIRERMRAVFDGPRRVLVREGERTIVARAWQKTVADVYGDGRPEGAAARVRAWAAALYEDLTSRADEGERP